MKKVSLHYKIFLQARRFEDSAEILFKQTDNIVKRTFIPALVLASFSLELYLKAIQQFEKKTIKKSHSLKEIFNELNKESKEKIIDNFNKDLIFDNSINKLELEKISGVKISNDFDAVLEDASSLFVDFRYIFERNKGEKSFYYIENLRKVVLNRVIELGIDNPK